MISLGVKGRTFVLAFVPMLFITILLSAYFIHQILKDIDNAINDRGEAMSMDLANASEYGMFSGNIDSLKALMESSLEENDVISILVLDKTGNLLLNLATSKNNGRFGSNFDPEARRTFTHSIILHTTPVSDIFDNENDLKSESKPDVLGWVAVEMSTRHLQEEQKQSIRSSIVIIIFGILGSILLSLWIARGLTVPIGRITNAVRNIEKGNLDVQIKETSTGEIGALERGVKSMIGKIRLTQQELQQRIDEATAGLNSSLKLLERQNKELTEARTEALQASQTKSRFLANISHEIRTPMNGILGFVHLLLNSPITKEQKEYLNTIDKSANNLLTLIEDILDLSRAEAGKLPLRYVFFNIQECVEEVTMLMTPSAQAKNLEITAIHYSDTPFYINAPYERIRQILINLVGNAIKFSDAGTILLRTMLDHDSSDSDAIRITVSDQGIGIPDEAKNVLFTPFSQLDDSSTRTYGGSGLGLAISKSLARAMGGDIGISNESVIGSTFWFTFKFQQEYEQDQIYNPHPILGQYRVCLYDSNEFRNAAISSCFNHLGLDVSHFLNLEEFLDEIKNNSNYDICALSLSSQEPESGEIRNALKYLNDNSDTKILTFIYNKELATKSLILSLGADACLTRPCLQSNLLTTVSRLLNLDKDETVNITNQLENESTIEITNTSQSVILQGYKILVAEDNPINTKLLLTILKDSGAECLHAHNGEEAINIFKENNVNLVLMDKQMPVVSGFDAAKRIRKMEDHKSSVPIIGLTAATTAEELNEFMASGIDDILTKPISTEDLIHEILYWINHYKNLRNERSEENGEIIKYDRNKTKYSNNGFESQSLDKDLTFSLRKMLIDELPSAASKLKEAYSRNDWNTLREQLHKLLGGLSYCGLPELLLITKSVKTSVEQQSDSLDNDFNALLREIDNTLANHMNSEN